VTFDPPEQLHRSKLDWLRGALFLAGAIMLAWVLDATEVGATLHRDWIDHHVLGHGPAGYVILLALTAFVTAVGFPRQIPSLLAGYAFGAMVGFLVALAGTTAGAAAAYTYARLLGRGVVPRRLRRKMSRVERMLARGPLTVVLMIRLMPVGSNLLVNLVAGLVRLPPLAFLAGSVLGFVPQTFVFALMGKGLRVDPGWRIALAVALFAASAFLGHLIYRRLREHHRLDGAT